MNSEQHNSERARRSPSTPRPRGSMRPEALGRERRLLRKRKRRDKRFKVYTLAALMFAVVFLVVFLGDLVIRGYPALRQAEILVPVSYSPDTLSDVELSIPQELRPFVSRSAKWQIVRQAQSAEILVPVAFSEEIDGDTATAIEDLELTRDDMPPWMRDEDPGTIPREYLLPLIDDEGLGQIQARFRNEPELAGTTEKMWVRGSGSLIQFLADSSGLEGKQKEYAELLYDADHLQQGFNIERWGEEGQVLSQWLLADSEVDQYLKGYEYMQPSSYPNPENAPITQEEAELIDRLKSEGRVRLVFNHYFFLNGDSKTPEMAGMRSAVIGSAYVLALVLVMCLPVGLMTSIYLEEFAPDNFITRTIEVNINNLAAIPSILFGVLGLAALIGFFGMPRSSVLVGATTLALMTLPIIIVSSRAALRAVPDSIRQAGFAMGATRWQVVLHHVLPSSISGIMTGSIIGIAQAMGETAPLIIIGLVAFVPEAPVEPTDMTTVMPAQIYSWWGMPARAFQERAALAILVLLVVLFILNGLAVFIRARSERSW